MIGSIFPVCYRFLRHFRRGGWVIRPQAYVEMGGWRCVLARLAGRLVPPRASWSSRGFDWGLAARATARLRLAVAGCFAGSHLRHLLWAGAALGGVPAAAEGAALMRNLMVGHRDRLHRHHLVRPGRRFCAALPDRGERKGSGDLADRRLAAGADVRPADGLPAARVRAHAGAALRSARGSETRLGAGVWR